MDNNQVVNNTPEVNKKNNSNMLFLIAGIILIIIGVILYFTVFNKGGNNNNTNENTNTNTNKDVVDDGINYNEQAAPGSFDDIGKQTTGIIYGNGKKAKIEFKYVEEVLTEVTVNEKNGIFIESVEELVGAYQISDSIVLLKKNNETGKMEAYCYKLDGEFLMLQEITIPAMKYSKMEINGNNMDFYFTKHMGTTIILDNKNVNACNANELSNNNIADDYVVEQVFEINYTDDDASFHLEMPQHMAKTVADLKKSC